MRVLHLSFRAGAGGAAIAAHQLHAALRAAGVDSHMVACEGADEFADVDFMPTRATTWLESLPNRVRQKRDRLAIPQGAEFTTDRASMAASQLAGMTAYDVVHLHYINHGFDEATLFRRLQPGQRIIWTLHDAYPFTGGCHVLSECTRYTSGCGLCPRLGAVRNDDLSAAIITRKLDRFRGRDVTFVGPSRWITDCASRSLLGQGVRLVCIPEAVDTSKFVPNDSHAARAALGVPPDRFVVGWLAASVDDENKGLDLLEAAVRALPAEGLHVLWAGKGEYAFGPGCTHTRLGPRRGLEQVRQFYAACDVLAVPSRRETYCLAACEAASCGTPVVGFAATGLLDAVSDGETGFLVEPYSANALAGEIGRLASLPADEFQKLRAAVRLAAESKYDLSLLAQRHIEIYERAATTSGASGPCR